MDRRSFLKVLGVFSVAPVVVALAVERRETIGKKVTVRRFSELRNGSGLFDPHRTYGNYITVSDLIDPGDPGDPVLYEAIRFLEEDAHAFVPEVYRWRVRYEVQWPGRNSDPLNQLTTVTWKYTPETATSVMVREQNRLFFGGCRSGKTDVSTTEHIYDCLGYSSNWDV